MNSFSSSNWRQGWWVNMSDIIQALSMLNNHLGGLDCRSSRHEVDTIVYNAENVFTAVVPAVRNNHISEI